MKENKKLCASVANLLLKNFYFLKIMNCNYENIRYLFAEIDIGRLLKKFGKRSVKTISR